VAFAGLADYLRGLERRGELLRVGEPVSPRLEMAEAARQAFLGGGPALLFDDPAGVPPLAGRRVPVAMNLFGSERRMAFALGVERLDEIADRVRELVKLQPPQGFREKLAMLPRLAELTKFPPQTARSGACQSVVLRGEDVDLAALPIVTTWPEDAAPFLTLPQVVTRDPLTGARNVGCYRMQVVDRRSTILHWQRHKDATRHHDAARLTGGRIPVAVALGGDPAAIYAATAPLPPGIDEYLFTGFLRREPLRLVRCVTNDLEVPAESDLVLEGWVDAAEPLRPEGPFGDHTGYYTAESEYPLFHVEAVTRRDDAVYPATIVGRPPMEDFWMGHATERIFLPLLQLNLPEVVDYHMPAEGIFHNLVFVSVRKSFPGQAWKVMNGMWGIGLLSLAKVIVAVDEDVDVRNVQEAWWSALVNLDPERDVRFTKGPTDVLDHASREFSFGSKMGLDGTTKWPEEGGRAPWPRKAVPDPDVEARMRERLRAWGVTG
jgi:4-hydroxy-3-polyprenylbenzoate decarboxylase